MAHDSGTADVARDGSSSDATMAGPNPPPGWPMCGTGTITPVEALAACNGTASTPKDCMAVTFGAGSWTAWCNPGQEIYVWATMDGLSQTAATMCPSATPRFDQQAGRYELDGGGVGVGGFEQSGTDPSSLTYELQNTTSATSGTGTLLLSALLASAPACISYDANSLIVTGFPMHWN